MAPKRKKLRVGDLEGHPGTIVGDPDTLHLVKASNWNFFMLIAAHAMVWSAPLLTRYGTILQHYPLAFWEEVPPRS